MARIKIQKRKLRTYVILGIAAYALFMFISLPAVILSRKILPGMNVTHNLQLRNVSGTLWKGEALDASYEKLNLGKLQWNLHPLSLLVGNVNMDLKFNQGEYQGIGNVALGFGGKFSAEDLNLILPADELTNMIPYLRMSGTVHSNVSELEVKKGSVFRGKGRITVQQAKLTAPHNLDLGDLLIVLEPQNNNTKISITDQNARGQVEVNLKFEVQGSGKYRWEGTLKPRDRSDEKLIQLLRFIGSPDSTGNFWTSRSGQLEGW